MNRINKVQKIRGDLQNGQVSLGTWLQLPHPSIAEILGSAGYDWVVADLEHGSISHNQLPDLFRAIDLGDSAPLARIAQGSPKDCKLALDAGAAGLIVPMVESAEQLVEIRESCRWPPAGSRGVGFSRANLYGKNFEEYQKEAQSPLLVAMIESKTAVSNLNEILRVDGLDAILIGPYDLSASMGICADFNNTEFIKTLKKIQSASADLSIACGIHVVNPNPLELEQRVSEGFRFLPYSIDSVFLNFAVKKPNLRKIN